MNCITKTIFLFLIFSLYYTQTSYAQTNIIVDLYEDLNGDGTLDGGEPTIIATPELWQDTEPNGSYETLVAIPFSGGQFSAVPDGNYEVRYLLTSGSYMLLTPSSASDQVITSGADINLSAGYYLPASIGDFVWEDINGDGFQNDGPSGFSGVNIDLNGFTGLGVAVALSDVSGPGGIYNFSNLEPGNYIITFNSFFGFERTEQTTDSDPNQVTGLTGNIALTSGEANIDIDAGYFQFAEIGNFVWEDINGNGIQDGEPGIDGITVNLSGTDGAGNPVNINDVTSGGGFYEFDMVIPGDYTVNFTLPTANHFFTEQNATIDTDDSDADQTSGDASLVTVISNQIIDHIDAGMYLGSVISDLLWEDLNGDGVQDGGEPGFFGVDVNLSGTDGAGNSVNLGPISTNGAGSYVFDELPPGTYTIEFGPLPANHYFSSSDQTVDTDDSDPNPLTGVTSSIILISDQVVDDVDAGIFEAATIGDYVWEDLNGNGIREGGEPAMNGVTISISTDLGAAVTKADGNPANAVISGPAGAYLFDALKPGSYIITFEDFAGHFRTFQGVGGNIFDSDGDENNGDTALINLISGDTNDDIDGGYFRPGTIGDFTWIDFNGDGIQNDAGTLGGVNISLTDDVGAGVQDALGGAITPIVSNGVGAYSFTNLRPGLYKLTFSAPAGFFPTKLDASGGNNDVTDADDDSDVDQGNANMTFDIDIISGELEPDIDGGFYEPVTIGDFVWHDANADGIQGALETGVPGVTVEIENSDGSLLTDVNNVAIPNEITNGVGFYQFTNIRPGEYNITVSTPPMWLFSDPDVAGDATDSDFNIPTGDLVNPLQVNSNQTTTNIDAGIYKNIIVTGTVWIEQDDNGMQSGLENGAAGIEVQILKDPGNVVSGTNITNAMGEYMFSVKPGDYIISVVSGNFGPGNPLNGVISCTPVSDPNNDVDLDDNGSGPDTGPVNTTQINFRCGEEPNADGITNNTIDFCFKFDCGAQNNLSVGSCNMVSDTFCNLTILDAGCATMPSPPLVGNAPNPLCDGMGAPHNMSWFAFIAGEGNYELEIVPYGCLPGSDGNLGIQAGIYTDCTFSNSIFCMAACSQAPISISGSNFTPGSTYYFWFDGCSGSVCSYEINVNGTFNEYIIPEPTEVICVSSVCSPICPNNEVTLQVNAGYENSTLKFRWKITSPSGAISYIQTLENTLDYTVTELGNYNFEIETVFNKCNGTSTVRGVTILVRHPADEDFGEDELCQNYFTSWAGPQADDAGNSDPNGDGINGWQNTPFTFVEGNNSTTVIQDGCIYDQEVDVIKLLIYPPFNLDLILCPSEIPYTVSPDFPFLILGPMPENMITLLNGGTNGCDSLVNLEVIVLEASGEIAVEDCVNGKTKFRLQNYIIPDLPTTHEVRWVNSDGLIINDGDPDFDPFTILLSTEGSYTCEIVLTRDGKTCISPIVFLFSLNSLESPVGINWPSSFCSNTTQTVYTAQSSVTNAQFVWSYPVGVTVSNESTSALTVNWNGVTGGEICVSITDACGQSQPYCETVTIKPIPMADFDLETIICVDSTAMINFNLPSLPSTSYTWNLNGGSIIASPNSNGIDSLEVKWPSPGKKYISLSITRHGCTSPSIIDSLEVIANQLVPSISCDASATQIEFFWPPVPGQTASVVTILTGQTGFKFGNSYIISGLLPGVTVDIQVTFISPHPCGNVTAFSSCITQNCTPEPISIDSIPFICLETSGQLVDLKQYTNTVTNNGIFKFTGPGVIDELNGVFDPVIAGLGTHQIRFDYTDLISCISSAAFTNITIKSVPTSDFTSDNVICQDSFAIINYTGNLASGGSFLWDFGPDVISPGTGMGPFSIRWASPGIKTITLTTSNDGCISTINSSLVNVAPRILPVSISCPTIGSTVLTFDWNDVVNTSDYSLNLNGQNLPDTQQSLLTIINLTTDTDYSLIVRANSNNACPGVSDTLVCKTLDCPPVFIKFSIPDSIICFAPNLSNIDINATVTGGLQSVNQTLTWSGPGVNASTGVFNPNIAGIGTHDIKISLVDGTCLKDTSMKITIIAKPISNFTGDDNICITDNYLVMYSGTTNLPLNWQLPTGVTLMPAPGLPNQFKITFPSEGSYNIGLVTGNANCLSDPSLLNIDVDPVLDTVSITCQQTTTSINFLWADIDCASLYEIKINNVNKGTQASLNYQLYNLLVGEKVEIEIIPVSDCECPGIASSKICEAKSCPDIDLKLSTPLSSFCEGTKNTPFQLISIVGGSNGSGTGIWSGQPISSSGMFNPAGIVPKVYPLYYNFTEESCDFVDSIFVEVFQKPELIVTTIQPDCYLENFGQANILTQKGTNPYSYTLNGTNTVIPLGQQAPGDYEVMVKDNNNCSDSVSYKIITALEPTINLNGNTNILSGQSTELTAIISGLISSPDSIVWVNSKDSIICHGIDCFKINVAPLENDTYCVKVYFNNECSISECIDIKVKKVFEISIPNVFSPNGSNSTFYLEGYPNIKTIKSMNIFDRWGNLMFAKENFPAGDKSFGWDGKFNSAVVIAGVYIYKFEIETVEGNIEFFVGDVTVL